MKPDSLPPDFDAVVMLTWSDWKTEPRSNRYHFATRFARDCPVIFVQPDLIGDGTRVEPVPGHAITILHVPHTYGPAQSRALSAALKALGVRRPLLWIYNVYFEHFIRRASARLRVYHATEDYLSPEETLKVTDAPVQAALRRVLASVDLLVSVSDGVARTYERHGGYSGPSLVLRNGCDFPFWRDSQAADYRPPSDNAKVVLFQGGINSRLDYDLLLDLTAALPDFQFWFCGKAVDAPAAWASLKERPNVRDFGLVSSDEIAALSRQALVGIIPFRQDALMRRSLPLKAYEYVACGLPVVTIPIDELEREPDLFAFATTASDFASAIVAAAPTRTDPGRIAERLAAASRQSYDNRFPALVESLSATLPSRLTRKPRGSLLILYDDQSMHVRTIEEHLAAFRAYSRHTAFYLPATGFVQGLDDSREPFDFSAFDAVIIHYSVRLSVPEHLSPAIASILTAYDGPKLLFIQDEYDATETARAWIDRLGIDAVFTTVPEAFVEAVYPRDRFPNVDFIPTLTGYVPEDAAVDALATPLDARTTLIGYRGRQLPYHYGDLGREKYEIGIQVKRLAQERGLPVDIEVEDASRIYGNDWYRFLGSSRATLGTESGSNVFDFDGALAKASADNTAFDYPTFRERYLSGLEGLVQMNQISPKIFEAIRLRTALVLFEGDYSGVVTADRHFIPLKKDYSNFDAVVKKLQDDAYLRDLTERAYAEIIESGLYSYESFIRGVDTYLDGRFEGRVKGELLTTPALNAFAEFDTIGHSGSEHPASLLITNTALRHRLTLDDYGALARRLANASGLSPASGSVLTLLARGLWRSLPDGLRHALGQRVRRSVLALRAAGSENPHIKKASRLVPTRLRNLVRRSIR
ncbi:glycosyltransferase [Microvirga antarctica]|uniref:glycosyltransferase n=1 Tax=Microvirga antarctica TaxID=2819233 RepID=UPI001B30B607|nr:glycosyltransferase [Microvirga antarctica]